jgi:hypothetical protein
MPYARFLVFMAIATLLGLLGWIYVLFSIDPFTSGWIGPVSFYVSLGVVCVGGFFLLGALLHRLTSKEGPVLPRHVRAWFRRSFLLSLGTIVSLLLASIDRFSFLVFFLFLLVLFLLEGFFLFVHQGRRV